MTNTRFPYLGNDQNLKTPYLLGLLKYQGQISKFDKDNLSSAVSEGNINTTPRDLANWAYQLYGTEDILNKEIRKQMLTFQPSGDVNVNYGLGAVNYPEDLGYGHDGVRPAFMTIMRYEPNSQTSFVLFSNFLNFDKVGDQNNEMHQMVREALEMVKAAK